MGSKKGFTLLEIVIAIIVLVVLMTVGISLYYAYIKQSYGNSIRNIISALTQAITLYYQDTNQYPSRLEDLEKNPGVNGWAGAYTNYPISNNQIALANQRIVITYQKSVSGNTLNCGYVSNRPALILKNYADPPKVEGLCIMKKGSDTYYILP